jgi:hypothetical protein
MGGTNQGCLQPPRVIGGPAKSIAALKNMMELGVPRDKWVEQARNEAVILSAPASLQSCRSALKAWAAFADLMLAAKGKHFPPSEQGLIAWSRLFRNAKTYANYVSHVALGCDILGVTSEATRSNGVRRAKAALRNSQAPPREKLFIQRETVAGLVKHLQESCPSAAMLFLASYIFLLRVPSEAIPLCCGAGYDPEDPIASGEHSRLWIHGETLHLKLSRRKNKPHGTHLMRSCWCKRCAITCPVHTLGKWIMAFPAGAEPFIHFSPSTAMKVLRESLAALGIEKPNEHRLHDLRRGHTQDLVKGGAQLHEILKAGEWRTPAFLAYLDVKSLETRVVIEAHELESSDSGNGEA